MAFSTTPLVGIDLNRVITSSEITSSFGGNPPFKTGLRVDGSDGKAYVFAKVNTGVTITAPNANCNITLSSGVWVVAASGGTYTAPASMAAGDYGWFSKTSV